MKGLICDLCHQVSSCLHHLAKWESRMVEVQEHAGWGYGPESIVTREKRVNTLHQRKVCRTCLDGVRAMQEVAQVS